MSGCLREARRRWIGPSLRIRPGRLLILRPPLLRLLGADPARLMIEHDGPRLVIAQRPSRQETRLARFKSRLEVIRMRAVTLSSWTEEGGPVDAAQGSGFTTTRL